MSEKRLNPLVHSAIDRESAGEYAQNKMFVFSSCQRRMIVNIWQSLQGLLDMIITCASCLAEGEPIALGKGMTVTPKPSGGQDNSMDSVQDCCRNEMSLPQSLRRVVGFTVQMVTAVN